MMTPSVLSSSPLNGRRGLSEINCAKTETPKVVKIELPQQMLPEMRILKIPPKNPVFSHFD